MSIEKQESAREQKEREESFQRKFALDLGNLIIRDIREREGDRSQPEIDIGFDNLRTEQRNLETLRMKFTERYERKFPKMEQAMGRMMEGFRGDQTLLREALASELRIDPREKEKDNSPEMRTRRKQYEKVRAEFDKFVEDKTKTREWQADQTSTYVAAYTVLQGGELARTEDKMNGVIQQEKNIVDKLVAAQSALVSFLANNAQARAIMTSTATLTEKTARIKALGPQAKQIIDAYCTAAADYARQVFHLRQMRKRLGRLIVEHNEQISIAREKPKQEELLRELDSVAESQRPAPQAEKAYTQGEKSPETV